MLGLDGLKAILPTELPRLAGASIDARVLAFAVGAVFLSAILSAIAPALRVSRLRLEAGRATGRAESARPRTALTVTQVAFSTALLLGAALLARSLWEMRRVPLGFAPSGIVIAEVSFPWSTDQPVITGYTRDALAALSSLPGAVSAGVTDRLPLAGGTQTRYAAVRGRDLPPDLAARQVGFRAVSPDYLSTLGVPLRSGRWLRDAGPDGPRELLINETFERLYFPDGRALDSEINFERKGPPRWYRIVGITGDVRRSLADANPPAETFVLASGTYWPALHFAVRTAGDPAAFVPSVREALRRAAPRVPIDRVETMEASLGEATRTPATRAALVTGFAAIALVLAAIGLFGILAADVAARTKEFGIRLALGAAPANLRRSILSRGLRLTLTGLAIGLLLSIPAGRALSTMLYGVPPYDPAAIGAASAAIALLACAAAWTPARRASSVDPGLALRAD